MRENREIISKVLRRVRPYRGHLIGSLLLALVYVAMSLYIPILVGDAIDGLGKEMEQVVRSLLAVAVCAVVAGLSQWVMNQLNNHVTYRITRISGRRPSTTFRSCPCRISTAIPRATW